MMDAEEFLGELSELTYWEYSAGRQTSSRRTSSINVGRVFGIDFWHLDPVQGEHAALVAAAVPWVGYDDALGILRRILTEDHAVKWTGAGMWKFRRFWEDIDYWPGVVESANDRIQYGTTVRDDDRAASDYRAAYQLHRHGFSNRFLFAALRNPGMLADNSGHLYSLAEEYAAEALGLGL